jgi:glycerophosphoryl diester phosphodiesterase
MLSKKRIVAGALLVILIAYAVIALIPRKDNFTSENPMLKDGELPILIAHGGGNREFPDNTLEAFYNAYSVDKRVMMETDVSITKDGVVILSHDTTIDRKTNATGAIIDWNYSDLIEERVDFGYTNPTKSGALNGERVKFKNPDGKEVTPLDVEYPDGVLPRDNEVFLATTLEELITSFPNNRINVEIKQSGEVGLRAFESCLDLAEKYDAFDRIVFASFHSELYDEFMKRIEEGSVPDNFMCSPSVSGMIKYYGTFLLGLDIFYRDGIAVCQISDEEYGISLISKSFVNNAHKRNVAVYYWTINDEDTMRRLIEIDADGIMTDYPHKLAKVYMEYSK